MKEHLIDFNFLNYLFLIFTIFLNKYTFNFSIQVEQINIYENYINYNSILNLKNLIISQFITLRDLTVVNYLGLFKDLELHYFFVSYKLNIKSSLKKFINKEDLIISLIEIFVNSN